VPYQVLGTRFFERKEVKDALAHLRASLNPKSAADVTRAIQALPRGIGKVTLAKVIAGREHELPAGAQKKISEFRGALANIARAVETKKASEAVRYALAESGLAHLYQKGGADEAERLENLKELVTVASKYDMLEAPLGIERLLEEAALQSDQDELDQKKEGVKLMTVHAAKGLEFDTVFVTGLEEGLFPHERDESDKTDDEEERRLFYVALTRAKRKAYLTYAMTRRIFGTRSINAPSEFIAELDPDLAEVISTPSLYDETPSIS
jgi:DNA helicase-2/ATP-dependent DNA helicase PcrA